MATRVFKMARSKGERLGWISLDKVAHVSLSSMVVRGRRVYKKQSSELSFDADPKKLIIP
jgi:hypothetical protein